MGEAKRRKKATLPPNAKMMDSRDLNPVVRDFLQMITDELPAYSKATGEQRMIVVLANTGFVMQAQYDSNNKNRVLLNMIVNKNDIQNAIAGIGPGRKYNGMVIHEVPSEVIAWCGIEVAYEHSARFRENASDQPT